MARSTDPRDIISDAWDRERLPSPTPEMMETSRRQRLARIKARNVEIMTLRLAGMSNDKIGERFGLSAQRVAALISTMLAKAHHANADQMRELENARLDRVQAAIWPRVLQGDLKAITTYLRLSQQRAALNGLNAPTRVELAVSVREELEQSFNDLEALVLEVEQLAAPTSGPGSRRAKQRAAIEQRASRDAADYAEQLTERIVRDATAAAAGEAGSVPRDGAVGPYDDDDSYETDEDGAGEEGAA